MKRLFSSLRRKQQNTGVFRRTIALQQPISVMANFRTSQADRAEKEESAPFHGWTVFFNEIAVVLQFFQSGKQGWMRVTSHFHVFPESAVAYSLLYSL